MKKFRYKEEKMTEKLQIFKCDICGNVIEITHDGADSLVCCNQDMKLLPEHIASQDNAHYAHFEEIDDITKKIHFNHVMNDQHHIEYIEVISNDKKYIKRKFLQENETPELIFRCKCEKGYYARLYCNLDGVWITKWNNN